VNRTQLEQRLLVLVTLGLVAFGLVMVFSATSASAALGEGDPMRFLVKQGLYALAGLTALAALSRFDYHRLRAFAPILLLGSFAACVAVLAVGPAINGAHRWFIVGPVSLQPSELAKLAVCIWVCAVLARRPAPRTMGELMKPVGLVVAAFGAVIVIEPDLGTTIALFVMVSGVLLVSGMPLRLFVLATTLALGLGGLAIWMEPYRRARVFSFLDPGRTRRGRASRRCRRSSGSAPAGSPARASGRGSRRSTSSPRRTRT
jgi:cell division protein FtsW